MLIASGDTKRIFKVINRHTHLLPHINLYQGVPWGSIIQHAIKQGYQARNEIIKHLDLIPSCNSYQVKIRCSKMK